MAQQEFHLGPSLRFPLSGKIACNKFHTNPNRKRQKLNWGIGGRGGNWPLVPTARWDQSSISVHLFQQFTQKLMACKLCPLAFLMRNRWICRHRKCRPNFPSRIHNPQKVAFQPRLEQVVIMWVEGDLWGDGVLSGPKMPRHTPLPPPRSEPQAAWKLTKEE